MIQFAGAGKTYLSGFRRRAIRAVDSLDFEVRAGEIFGIAGPNGAGKSTLISLLLGFIRPTTGTITIHGMSSRAWVEAHGAGYLPELVTMPGTWNVRRALIRFATLADVPASERAGRVESALETLGIGEYEGRRVRQLSKGNLQRLALAQALLSRSDLVILDEPTHGLDPVWIQRFRTIARGLRQPGRAVVIASHYLDELERVCDRVAIMDKGRLQRIVTIGATAGDEARAWRIVVTAGEQLVRAVFPLATPVPDGQPGEFRIPDTLPDELQAGLRRLLEADVRLTGLSPEQSQLEATFHQLVREEA